MKEDKSLQLQEVGEGGKAFLERARTPTRPLGTRCGLEQQGGVALLSQHSC